MYSIQSTLWKDLSNIKKLLKLNLPAATFDIFSLFQWQALAPQLVAEMAAPPVLIFHNCANFCFLHAMF